MFEVLDEVCTPKRGTKYSAYIDLFARENVVIEAGQTKIVKLGIKLDLKQMESIAHENRGVYGVNWWLKFLKSNYLEVALRSSLGAKGLVIANGIGIIDLDYGDEIGLIVHNPINRNNMQIIDYQDGTTNIRYESFNINKGDKVAQCTLKEHKGYLMGYDSDAVRNGGFGSTGK